jgi:hypothetical protein
MVVLRQRGLACAFLALLLAGCGGGGGGGGSEGSSSASTPVSGSFFCTFQTAPTDCSFKVQEKVPGRASIIGIGRDGGTALRLRTEPGDNNVAGSGAMERADVYLATQFGAPIVYHEGEDQWWSISVMFPNDFTFPRWHTYALFNFHHEGGTGANIFEFGFRRNPAGDSQPGILRFRGAAGNTSASPAVRYESDAIPNPQRNVWYDVVFHVKWSSGAGGFFHAWVNGERVLAHSGPTLFAGEGVYLKLANYHNPVCDPYPSCIGSHSASSVIYDRIVLGRTAQQVSRGPLEGALESVNGVLTPMTGL